MHEPTFPRAARWIRGVTHALTARVIGHAPNASPLGTHAAGTAELILWQNRVRVGVASLLAVAVFVLRDTGILAGRATPLIIVLPSYLWFIVGATLLVRRRGRAGSLLASVLTAGDVIAVFAATLAMTPPSYFSRALLLAVLVLQYTQLLPGIGPSVVGVVGTLIGYVTLLEVAAARGTPVAWGEEVWTLTLFALAAINAVALQRSFRKRLSSLVDLFGHAQRGDFSLGYDDGAETPPDAVSYLGRAYNQLRSQLSALVLTDPLTGCLNRRGFEQELQRYVARAARYGGELSLLAVDIDHFKSVNDVEGHLAGDDVLRELGELLVRAGRAGDVVARLGGEEFAIILPHADGETAGVVGERLLELVRTHRFRSLRRTPQVTASAGIAAEQIVESTAANALRARADEALYVAKRLGRNRVVLWAPGIRSNATPPWTAMYDNRVSGASRFATPAR